MIDDPQLETLLRARPVADPSYQPVVGEILRQRPPAARAAVSVRWRPAGAGLVGQLVLLLLMLALVFSSALIFVGNRTSRDLVVVPTQAPAAVAAPAPIPFFPGPKVADVLERFATARWTQSPSVSLDLSVVHGGRIWNESYNTYAGSSIVRIGTLSRLLLVPLALRYADDGDLDLEAPVSRYVPAWTADDTITVRQVMDGSSGVAAFGEPVEELARRVAADPDREWSAADALRLAQERPPRFAPGTRHEAVDTDDALLVNVVEAIAGSSIQDVVYDILSRRDPMLGTWLVEGPDLSLDDLPGPIAGWWDPDDTGTLATFTDIPKDTAAVLGAARGMLAPVHGLVLATDGVRSETTTLSAAARASLDRSYDDGGLGGIAMCPCRNGAPTGVGLVGHTGPYTALVVYIPEERMSIALVANVAITDKDLAGLLDDIHDIAWPALK